MNVWAGVVGDRLVGPHVLPRQLTGNHYLDFLSHELPKLLEDVPLAAEHDCGTCIAVLRHIVRGVLSNANHDGGIGRGCPTAWLPLSAPDLNPLDFYLCGHLKALVYAAPVDNEDALHRIVDACQTIRTYPGIFSGCGGP
jgi:hypothetical protein